MAVELRLAYARRRPSLMTAVSCVDLSSRRQRAASTGAFGDAARDTVPPPRAPTACDACICGARSHEQERAHALRERAHGKLEQRTCELKTLLLGANGGLVMHAVMQMRVTFIWDLERRRAPET